MNNNRTLTKRRSIGLSTFLAVAAGMAVADSTVDTRMVNQIAPASPQALALVPEPAWGRRRRYRDYSKGPGWTHAQVKRMARRRRNVARNRAHHAR